MTKEKILQFKGFLQKGIEGKFTRNRSICNFYLLCPKNGQPMYITYNTKHVGKIENGRLTLNEFDKDVWGKSVYKYDLLHEIMDEFHPKKPAPKPKEKPKASGKAKSTKNKK